jgi:hypothetical protein
MCYSFFTGFDSQHLDELAIAARVRVVESTLADLDCEKKVAVLADGSQLPYDYLVLCPGLQDQMPTRFTRDDSPLVATEAAVAAAAAAAEAADDYAASDDGLESSGGGGGGGGRVAGVFALSNEEGVVSFLTYYESRRPQPIVGR